MEGMELVCFYNKYTNFSDSDVEYVDFYRGTNIWEILEWKRNDKHRINHRIALRF